MSASIFSIPATRERIQKSIAALVANGIDAELVATGADAKRRVLEIIPVGVEVMTMTSVTLDAIGVLPELNDSGRFQTTRAKFSKMNPKTDGREMKRLGAAPEWAVGSVHAATEDGTLMIASNTGSQLPAYAYGADHVLWVVGAQKIVRDFNEGLRRIYEYTLPLESERARKAYGVAGSFVSKLLVINKEITPGRARVIFVNEAIGF